MAATNRRTDEVRARDAVDGIVRCYYCRRVLRFDVSPKHPAAFTVDHKTPRARGGNGKLANLVSACFQCNHRKGPLTAGEFAQVRHDVRALERLKREVNARHQALVETRSKLELDRLSVLGGLRAGNRRPPKPETLARLGITT